MEKKKTVRFILLTCLIIFLLIVGLWTYRLVTQTKDLLSLVGEIEHFQEQSPGIEDISEVINIIGRLSSTVNDIKEQIDPILPVVRAFSKLPLIGGYFGNVEPGLELASYLSNAAVILGRTGEPFIDGSLFETKNKLPQVVNDFFLDNQQNFAVAEEFFYHAKYSREKINMQYIPERFHNEIEILDRYMELSTSLISGIKMVPFLFGASEPTTYLLMVQNKDEIRPTGGFITAFGIIQIRAGRIFVLKIDDSTSFDYVSDVRKPPEPLEQLMFANYLVPRDANWSPDFPQSAKLTSEMYQSSTEIEMDMVLAFDQKFIADLLEFSGPILISDEDEAITSSNVEIKMIEYKHASWDENTINERKEFLSILGPKMLNKVIEKKQLSELVDLVKLIFDEIKSGHLSIFSFNPIAQEFLEEQNLDNSVDPGTGDYLMVVDSNVGFGKIDQFISRSISYMVDLQNPETPTANLSIRYAHNVSGEEPCFQGRRVDDQDFRFRDYYFPRCYWDYWRVLLAPDAEVRKVESVKVPEKFFHEGVEWDQEPEIGLGENDTSQVGALIVVPQLSEQEVKISVILPEYILEKNREGNLRYLLRIQKQNGLRYLPVEIRIQPPSDHTVQELSDGWVVDPSTNDLIWQGEIDRTTDFMLTFIPME